MTDIDWIPFNSWQLKNCATCSVPDPCPFRVSTYADYEQHGHAALAGIPQCPQKKELS